MKWVKSGKWVKYSNISVQSYDTYTGDGIEQ